MEQHISPDAILTTNTSAIPNTVLKDFVQHPYRFMGMQAYYAVMKDLFPTLSNQTDVPELIEGIAKRGGNGITNGKGFYDYTPDEAAEWEKAYEEFAFDISRLSAKYPIDLIEKRLKAQAT